MRHALPTLQRHTPIRRVLLARCDVTANNSYPAGDGSAAIFRSMPANSRRVRCPSANCNQ